MEMKKQFATGAAMMMLTVHLATASAAQSEPPQTWVPKEVVLPEDAEVLSEREIGSSLRMFSFSTQDDVDDLLATWQEDLRLAGYSVMDAEGATMERTIEFSGNGINNAKIAVVPAASEEQNVIQFDATLR
ncbi:hypothetical protein [Yoonia sp.]|uniref:hypothetical protein n=1 Tax=Yoonia sp. TaxID=2212373 RepID=UPI002E02E963|nr:hypothetical protein [Yoonia sp.]